MRAIPGLLGLALLAAAPRFAGADFTAPAQLDFGNTVVAGSSSQTLTLTSDSRITVTGMTITGSTLFSFDPPVAVPFDLRSSSPNSFPMLFSPTARGNQQATLTITSEGFSPKMVTLKGRGVAPVISTAATLSFGDVVLPGSADRVLRITNSTSDVNQTLVVSSGSFTGPDSASFSIVSGAFPLFISTGNYSDVTVRFSPSAAGAKSATAHIASNDPLTVDKTVPFSGNGIGPAAVSGRDVGGFALATPMPNPFAADTELAFSLPASGAVTLEVFDAAGHRVRSLVSGVRPAGRHSARWDGRDDRGGAVHGGLYFVRLTAAGRSATARLARLR